MKDGYQPQSPQTMRLLSPISTKPEVVRTPGYAGAVAERAGAVAVSMEAATAAPAQEMMTGKSPVPGAMADMLAPTGYERPAISA